MNVLTVCRNMCTKLIYFVDKQVSAGRLIFTIGKKLPKDLADRKEWPTFAAAQTKEASLAQLAEQLTLNQWVQGSNP